MGRPEAISRSTPRPARPGVARTLIDRGDAHLRRGRWVPCGSRSSIEHVVAWIATGELVAYRIEGESALGKSRLVIGVATRSVP